MSEPTLIESVAVQAVARLVALRHGPQARLVSLSYRILHPLGMIEEVKLTRFLAVPETSDVSSAAPTETGLRAEILAFLETTEKPLKGVVLARRMRQSYDNSHFRQTLADLRREGKIDNYPGRGYWLVSRGTPPE